jgi:hypothetical protein
MRAGPRRIALAATAVVVACAAGPRSEPSPVPAWDQAGRVIGGRTATVSLGRACARAYPDLATPLGRALADWRWRNDALAVEVEDAMWRSARSRGASEASVAAGRAELARGVDETAAEVATEIDTWTATRRRRYCGGLAERLLSGDEDLARRYPAELRTWHPAVR